MAQDVMAPQSTERRRSPGRTRLAFFCLALLLFSAAAAFADRRGTGKRRGSQVRSSTSVTAPRQLPQAQIPRRLLPPAGLGSAANVGPNFYRQLDAPAHGGGVVPNVVYVYPQYVPYNTAPPVFDNSGTPSSGVNPGEPIYATAPPNPSQPQPIYIERESSNTAGSRGQGQDPQPVYIVERPAPDRVAPPAPASPPPVPPAPVAPKAPPKPKVASAVVFSIQPEDAKVFLDNDPMGSALDVNGREDGWILDPGVHVLEVEHPDLKTQRLVFGVGSGDPMEILVDLTADTPQRRSRIR